MDVMHSKRVIAKLMKVNSLLKFKETSQSKIASLFAKPVQDVNISTEVWISVKSILKNQLDNVMALLVLLIHQ